MSKYILLFLCLIQCSTLCATKLQSIQLKQLSGKTSLFFTLDHATSHKAFILTNPNRVVVDFENTTLAVNLRLLKLHNPLITLVRSGNPNPHTLRLVFVVKSSVNVRSHPLNTAKENKQQFSLDISTKGNNPIVAKPIISKAKVENKIAIIKHQVPKRLRDVVVVLDPGHGGKDPGASGPRRSLEKNVTYAIAVKLKQIIDRQPGMRAVLTRKGDYYIGLRERLKIARNYNADVFVSIHADAFINRQSNGASVFALSQRGATSEAARWLAEKENYSELGGVNLKDLDDQTGLVRTVLIDLSQTATIGASLHMGDQVLRHLNTMTRLHNHKVEQARFMVLKSPDIPSILIETGFISNPREEMNLTNYRYQTRLTQAVFQGLKNYFWDYPPHDTRIEALTSRNIHLVKRGESLPKIAARYHVSVTTLQAANNLSNSQIKAGQRLTIPTKWS